MFTRQRILMLVVLSTAAVLQLGCGRGFHIVGRVVTFSSLEASESLIAEIASQPMPKGGTPVDGAKVTILYDLNEDGLPNRQSVFQRSVRTDGDGWFEIEDYVPSGDAVNVGLEVRKDGYDAAYSTYIDMIEHDPEAFWVILVPVAAPN